MTFSFGPAFFSLINTGIKHGHKTGSLLAFGIVLSDFTVCVLIILLVHFGFAKIIHDPKSQRFMGILAGVVLLVFGAFHFKAPPPASSEGIEIRAPSPAIMIFKGFFLNILNPTVWLLWLGNVTAVSDTLDYSIFKMILYFGITLGIVLCCEFCKVYAAGKLKKLLTHKLMHRINVVTGALLILCGLFLIYNHYF